MWGATWVVSLVDRMVNYWADQRDESLVESTVASMAAVSVGLRDASLVVTKVAYWAYWLVAYLVAQMAACSVAL